MDPADIGMDKNQGIFFPGKLLGGRADVSTEATETAKVHVYLLKEGME
jgi:hypothetical protein